MDASDDGAQSLPEHGQGAPETEQYVNKMDTEYFYAIAKILMSYLEQHDADMCTKANKCYEMSQLRATVGETYWNEATNIFLKQITATESNANVMRLLCDGALDTLKIAPLHELDEVPTFHLGNISRKLELTDLNGFDWLGYFIGKSKTLRELRLDFPYLSRNQSSLLTIKQICRCYCRFIQGINFNKSIQKLRIYYSNQVCFAPMFTPLLRNNANLTDFEVVGDAFKTIEDARHIALALTHRGKTSLKNFSVWGTNVKQDGFREITAIMNAAPQLEQFHFRGLANTHVDNQGARALVSSLANCHNLKSIRLGTIHDNWIQVISPSLPNFRMLTDLDLSHNRLTDEGIQALAPSLANCHMLTTFDISINEWEDNGMQQLATNLANCHKLTTLNISQPDCTAVGINSLSAIFQSTPCSLSRLGVYLDNDSMIEKLVWGLEGNKSLKYLDFDMMPECTNRGWIPLSKLLCNKSSISNTYYSNHTLEALIFDDREDEEEPENIFDGSSHGECEGVVDIRKFLELNKRSNKRDVSIAKILMSHSRSAFDMGLLFNWNLSFLPLMLAWLQRADMLIKDGWPLEMTGKSVQVRQLSTIYDFVAEMSMMVVQQLKSLNSRKRKFEKLEK